MDDTLPTEDARAIAGVPDGFGRLWTPHRMAYIRGEKKPVDSSEGQCPFCAAPGKDDVEGLIVYRGTHCFVLMNLFPYNSGHVLVCPYRHVADYTELTDAERVELGELTAHTMRVLRSVSNPDGFNLGMNQGAVAGAGIAAHLHQHVVPRWGGDANFLPIIAQTKALPELLDDARARLAQAWHSVTGEELSPLGPEWPIDADGYPHRQAARVIVFDADGRLLLVHGHDGEDKQRSWWFTIGGGITPGEDPAQAAMRELEEETGIRVSREQLIGPVMYREATFKFLAVTARQDEQFFVVRLPDSTPELHHGGWTQLEKDVLDEQRWWDLDELEIEAQRAILFPADIIERARGWWAGWDGKVAHCIESSIDADVFDDEN